MVLMGARVGDLLRDTPYQEFEHMEHVLYPSLAFSLAHQKDFITPLLFSLSKPCSFGPRERDKQSSNLFEAPKTAVMDTHVRPSYKPGLTDRLLVGLFHLINKLIPWHKLPAIVGALNLEALRVELREYNLHDGYPSGVYQGTQTTDAMTDERFEYARNSDGKFNSTEMPRMGCAFQRFGRNFPRGLTIKPTEDELWTPNPRMVSLN